MYLNNIFALKRRQISKYVFLFISIIIPCSDLIYNNICKEMSQT